MLPRVKIILEMGLLGLALASADGVLGLAYAGASPVANGLQLNTPIKVKSLKEVETIAKVTASNNAGLYRHLKDFYADGQEKELWVSGYSAATSLTAMLTEANAGRLITASQGRVRGILVARDAGGGYTPTIANGLDADVGTAIAAASTLATWAADVRFAPGFILIAAAHFTGNTVDLADLTSRTDNRVALLVGDTVASSTSAAIGVVGGRIAAMPVQRNIGRVKDGPLKPVEMFIGSQRAEVADVATVHDKGYISFRTYVGRSGYFITDDPMATSATDDYGHLTHRRTIDKAARIAYSRLLDLILDEVPVTNQGKLQTPYVKAWQQELEGAIAAEMTANGELSADPANANDRGVQCLIDANQNIISNSRLNIQLRVRPFGYNRYVDLYLGFMVAAA